MKKEKNAEKGRADIVMHLVATESTGRPGGRESEEKGTKNCKNRGQERKGVFLKWGESRFERKKGQS